MAAGFLISTALSALAGDVKIVANPSVEAHSISVAEIRTVFLLQRRALKGGSAVVPVLQKSGPAHEAFLRRYLKRDPHEIRSYYQSLVFTGKSVMPKELNSDADVVAYVARTRGAIGYVSPAAATEGVKVLVISDEPGADRTLLTRVEPEYPETLRNLGIGGTVRLKITISPKGAVENVELLGGNPVLADAAMKAVQRWIYSPASSSTTVEVSIPFEARR